MTDSGETCTLTGTSVQNGLLYSIPFATYVCTDGLNTTASVFNVKQTAQGIEGQIFAPVGLAIAGKTRAFQRCGTERPFGRVRRCRTHSNSTTAAAAAALSDSAPPGMGMVTRVSASFISASERPAPSLPIAIATRRRNFRRVEVGAAASDRGHHASMATKRSCPGAEVDILDDRRKEMRALRRPQYLRRPRERAVLRQQHLFHAGRRRGAQNRADVARVLHVLQQQVKGPRRRQRRGRRRDDGQHADRCRQRGHLAENRRRHGDHVALADASHERGKARIRHAFIDHDQRLRHAAPAEVDVDQVFAFEHATARLASIAR